MRTKIILFIVTIIMNICCLSAIPNKEKIFQWDENSPLLQTITDENHQSKVIIETNPIFQKIVPDIHYLVHRSYKSTKRDKSKNYIERHMLEEDEPVIVSETQHHWHCIKNFQGEQGHFISTGFLWSIAKGLLTLFSGGDLPREIDYPGFIAYKYDPNCGNDIIWIAVVLRGSQGEDFQPARGMLGASWLTNYSAGATRLEKPFYPFSGKMHSGYLNKLLSCEISMKNAINEALSNIGEDNFHRVRFIVTGHSQGGGLAQIALPMIINNFGYIYGGDNFNNTETPRFFGYFMSAPRISYGKKTTQDYINYVGANNIIRHRVYGDIVPMLCLRDYYPLGQLALDPFYDAVCRGIRSEMAYCNRYMLFWAIKDLFDSTKFTIDEKNGCWISRENQNFRIHWTELCKVISSQRTLHKVSVVHLFKTFLSSAFKAANPSRAFEDAKELPEVSDEFLMSLLKDDFDVSYIDKLLKRFVFFKDIKLDEGRKEKIFILGDELEKYHGNMEIAGITSAISIFTSLNAVTKVANSFDDFGEFIKSNSKGITPEDGIIVDNTLTPVGEASAIAYAHYGSQANYFKSQQFDQDIPSKNINLALRNGAELLRPKNKKERCMFVYEEGLPKILFELLEQEIKTHPKEL